MEYQCIEIVFYAEAIERKMPHMWLRWQHLLLLKVLCSSLSELVQTQWVGAGCKMLTAVLLRIRVMLDAVLCCWASISWQFTGLQCLYLKSQAVQEE
jgi:hypothetical protein